MKTLRFPTLLVLAASLLGIALFTGCNTMRGVGQDVERAGEKVQDASR